MQFAQLVIALVVGLLAGTHTATWGMYKDAPHEGFTVATFSRSILVAGALAVLTQLVLKMDLTRAPDIVVLFGLTYALERAVTEFWKTYIRHEDQSKYWIPMQFHVLGRVAGKKLQRLAGIGALLVAALLVMLVLWLQRNTPAPVPFWLALAIAGSLGGWFSAMGGAWKDAPIEGFDFFKFLRSPGIALFWAILLSRFTQNLLIIAIAAEGFTVATIETYKTFFFPDKPRGKWTGKPVHFPHMLVTRQRFRTVYFGIWAAVIVAFALAFRA
ncbi:MAG TPA: hypothetical protein VJ812_07630 [Gemmatimonadaceae bacterium]|jgi:hypothetical protein|nr:hypothetical protein [Gemmatimonadaceae bacterium]